MAKKSKQQRNNQAQVKRRQLIPRQIQNPGSYHFQGWVSLSSKPKIPKSQTTYGNYWTINPTNVPGLADYATRYQTVTVNSLGGRFKPALTHTPGLIAVLVLTQEIRDLYTLPAAGTALNHAFMKGNGSVVTQLIRQANSPPSNNRKQSVRKSAATTTDFGSIFFSWEGPNQADELSSVGELEIYVDALFEGVS